MDGNYNEGSTNGMSTGGSGSGNNGMMRYGGRSRHSSAEEGPWEVVAEMIAPFINRYDKDEEARYSRRQPRTSTGRFKRMRFSREMEDDKEEIASMLAREYGREELLDKAIKEASELIKCASENKEYEVLREFSELCIVVKAFAEFLPEDLEEQACEEAVEYYERKVGRSDDNPLEEYARRGRRRYRR